MPEATKAHASVRAAPLRTVTRREVLMSTPRRLSGSIALWLAICVAAPSCRDAGDAPDDAPDAPTVPENTVQGDLAAEIDAYVAGFTPDRFGGTVLVAKGGEVVLNKGYGMADRSGNIPNSSESVIIIGSITKQFTAAGILKLEMQGKLSTEDSLQEYFPDLPEEKRDITLHQLLTHTAGLIDYTGDDWDNGDFEVAPRDETIQEAFDAPLLSVPGEEFNYSNSSYSVLAAIIELVSGQSYEEYLSEHVFKPAGLDATGYRLPPWDEHVVSHYYVEGEDLGTPLERPYPQWNVLGNGGLLTTNGDLYRWHLALAGETVLSAEAKRKFYTPFLDNYALGWDVEQTDNGLLIQHTGGGSFGGADSAVFRRYVDAGVVIAVLGHVSFEEENMTGEITERIAEIVFGAG